MTNDNHHVRLGRRTFLRHGTLVLTAASCGSSRLLADADSPGLSVGLLTDLHYADKAPAGNRYYRQTLAKLEEAAQQFEQDKPSFLVELGDFVDAADSVDVEQETSYYSFDQKGIHFVVLDSCFRSDGQPYGRKNSHWTDTNIPPAQVEWLESDLKANDRPVVVFAHQRLDVSNHYGVKNNADVRKVLESAGNVLAVLQGHSHKNDLRQIGNIHYGTLVAMVEGDGAENNGYCRLEIEPDGTLKLTGFRNQQSRRWEGQR